MFYYLTCFATSSFLFWLAERIKNRSIELRYFIYGIALLIPTILAGIRDVSVGTDVLVYGYPIFKDACYTDNFGFFVNQWKRIEIGYLGLNFIVSRLTFSHNFFLGLIMFIEVLFVFLVLKQWKNKIPLWLGMLVFYLLFFNSSLNLMRQSLALSIAFFGIRFVFERKLGRFIFWCLLGALFHKSVLILILYYPFWTFTNKFTSLKAMIIFVSVGIISIVMFQQTLADYMLSFGDSISRVSNYITAIDKVKFPLNTLLFYSILTALFLYKRKSIYSIFGEQGYYFQYLVALLILIPFLDYYGGVYAYRFFPLVTWWLIILIPILFYISFGNRRILANIAIISYCFFYWYVTIIYQNANETADYLTIFEK